MAGAREYRKSRFHDLDYATYKTDHAAAGDVWRWEVYDGDNVYESRSHWITRPKAEKAAKRAIRHGMYDARPESIRSPAYHSANPPQDNTFMWVLGAAMAVGILWIASGGAGKKKAPATGRLWMRRGGVISPRQAGLAGMASYAPTTGAWATQRFGGPWPLDTARGTGL